MLETTERAIRYLAQSPLLQGVSEDILRTLNPPPEMIFLHAGETLIRKGEENFDYFVLVSGRLRAFDEKGGQLIPLKTVLPGEGVGEIALITQEPRSATVIARLDSELVRFPQSTFLVLAASQPLALLSIARTAVTRALGREPSRHTINDHPTIAILPLTLDIDTRPLARSLAHELETYGRSCSVDSDFTGVLEELEEQFDFVVYASGPKADNWSRYCLSLADLVLLVASVPAPSEPSEIEEQVLHKRDRKFLGRIDLLLIHPTEWQPHCGTARWLERLSPREHHHVRSGNTDDLARLARIIVGRANNVVLSGGGARAFAQIGALRALKEFRIPVDRIGGCSMGAGMGILQAFGDGFEDVARKLRELFLQRRPAKDFTLPLLSLLTGKKLANIGVDLFGAWRIEDLPTRYFCISSDLGTGEIVEHFDGLVWVALRGTAAIPVVAPPLIKDKRVLVDGGVLNNLPIDIMRNHFSGKILAIDVSRHEPLVVDHRWDLTCPSGFEILRHKVNPFGPKVGLPSIFEILLRTVTLASERQAQQVHEQADLLITPPVQTFAVTAFDAFDEIVEKGYQHTVRVLEQLSKSPEGLANILK